MQRYFSHICDGTDVQADLRSCTYGRAPNAIDISQSSLTRPSCTDTGWLIKDKMKCIDKVKIKGKEKEERENPTTYKHSELEIMNNKFCIIRLVRLLF